MVPKQCWTRARKPPVPLCPSSSDAPLGVPILMVRMPAPIRESNSNPYVRSLSLREEHKLVALFIFDTDTCGSSCVTSRAFLTTLLRRSAASPSTRSTKRLYTAGSSDSQWGKVKGGDGDHTQINPISRRHNFIVQGRPQGHYSAPADRPTAARLLCRILERSARCVGTRGRKTDQRPPHTYGKLFCFLFATTLKGASSDSDDDDPAEDRAHAA